MAVNDDAVDSAVKHWIHDQADRVGHNVGDDA
jgi:hypothetical protein